MQTKITLACVTPLQDDHVFERFYVQASKERRERIDRYRFRRDKMLSLGAYALLRHVMREAGYAGEPVLSYGDQGKPFLPGAEGFFFNLAHSGEYVMLAVSDAEVGCDIEQIRSVDLKLPRHVFHPQEYADIAACSPDGRDELFFRYWVLKESYIKALGTGLSQDLSSFCIVPGDPVVVMQNGEPRNFGFREGDDIPGYRYAVCREGGLAELEREIVELCDILGEG